MVSRYLRCLLMEQPLNLNDSETYHSAYQALPEVFPC